MDLHYALSDWLGFFTIGCISSREIQCNNNPPKSTFSRLFFFFFPHFSLFSSSFHPRQSEGDKAVPLRHLPSPGVFFLQNNPSEYSNFTLEIQQSVHSLTLNPTPFLLGFTLNFTKSHSNMYSTVSLSFTYFLEFFLIAKIKVFPLPSTKKIIFIFDLVSSRQTKWYIHSISYLHSE